jgi:hypothetical protein
MGMMVKPGNLKDFYCPEETKTEDRLRKDDVIKHKSAVDIGGDMKILLKHSHWTIDSVRDEQGKKCEKCDWFGAINDSDKEKYENGNFVFKPLRFHHCSICSDWVINMDHHCPWFNNCVGLNNQRFFLLFLWHLWLSSLFMLYFLYESSGHPYFYRYGGAASLAFGMHIGLFFGMGCFNTWQWYLALKGIPQIEYIQTRINKALKSGGYTHDYGLKSWRDNLYMTFGTRSLIGMFLPSLRSLPLNGLEFTANKKASNQFVN